MVTSTDKLMKCSMHIARIEDKIAVLKDRLKHYKSKMKELEKLAKPAKVVNIRRKSA